MQADLLLSPPAIGQALLFSPEIEGIIEAEEARGIYTAERALLKRPGLKDAVIKLRAAGEGYLSIAAKLNCHHRTASAISTLFAESVDIERAKRVNRMRSAADKLVELIDNEPSSVPPQMRALAASQLYDKSELLDGRATSRVERVERVDIYEDWDQVVEKHLEPGSVREIEVGPGAIGLGGRKSTSIEDQGDPITAELEYVGSDGESLVNEQSSEADADADTASDTEDAPRPAQVTAAGTVSPAGQDEAGGGVPARTGGPSALIDRKPQKFYANEPLPPPPI